MVSNKEKGHSAWAAASCVETADDKHPQRATRRVQITYMKEHR